MTYMITIYGSHGFHMVQIFIQIQSQSQNLGIMFKIAKDTQITTMCVFILLQVSAKAFKTGTEIGKYSFK